MIEIKDLNKSFGDTVVLKNLNLTIDSGSIFGLVGINGAGKSTLLRCLTGIYQVDSGTIQVDGQDVYENEAVKKTMIIVPDDPYFSRNSTINSLKASYQYFYYFDQEKFEKYLEIFHLDPNKNINNFSKGMKRQVFLLMALSLSPKILILDEAFDGLDPLVRLNFKKALTDLIEEKETTIIISSHNLKELEDICDCFGILDDHHITVSGDLYEEKALINKYQLAYESEKTIDDFTGFDIVDFKSNGRVINMVIKGDNQEIMDQLKKTGPILLETLPMNFEELFINEIEEKGGLVK